MSAPGFSFLQLQVTSMWLCGYFALIETLSKCDGLWLCKGIDIAYKLQRARDFFVSREFNESYSGQHHVNITWLKHPKLPADDDDYPFTVIRALWYQWFHQGNSKGEKDVPIRKIELVPELVAPTAGVWSSCFQGWGKIIILWTWQHRHTQKIQLNT